MDSQRRLRYLAIGNHVVNSWNPSRLQVDLIHRRRDMTEYCESCMQYVVKLELFKGKMIANLYQSMI
jgi:hypothetical protein